MKNRHLYKLQGKKYRNFIWAAKDMKAQIHDDQKQISTAVTRDAGKPKYFINIFLNFEKNRLVHLDHVKIGASQSISGKEYAKP